MDKPTETRETPGQYPQDADPPRNRRFPRALGLLLFLGLLLLVVGTAASNCLIITRSEEHDLNGDRYWQTVEVKACIGGLPPKPGGCPLTNIDWLVASTEGRQLCLRGAFGDWGTDWDNWDGGLDVAQAVASGSASLAGYCPQGHAVWWIWDTEWAELNMDAGEWGGEDTGFP